MKLQFEDDKWTVVGDFHDTHPQMKLSLERYLNDMDVLFRKAKQTHECEFILSLLGIGGCQGPGWDLLDGIEDTFASLDKLRQTSRRNGHGNQTIYLFMYGLILESDPLYELLANLLNVAEGGRFLIPGANFPDIVHPSGKIQAVPPVDKINKLKSRAKALSLNLTLFDDFYDKDLRNSLFHSDYVLYDNEIHLPNFTYPKLYKNEEWVVLTNDAMAYYQALTHLRKHHIGKYEEPKRIKPHPQMVHGQKEDMFVVVRKGYGVIGIKDAFTKEEIAHGAITHSIGRFYPKEQKLMREGVLLMPEHKELFINKIYIRSPKWLKKVLLTWYKKKK